MPKVPTKMLEQGRVTIPADIRAELSLESGDYIMIEVEPLSEANNE